MAEIRVSKHDVTGSLRFDVVQELSYIMQRELQDKVLEEAYKQIVAAIVEAIVKEKYGEILAKVDTQAIANLAIAQCASLVVKELRKE